MELLAEMYLIKNAGGLRGSVSGILVTPTLTTVGPALYKGTGGLGDGCNSVRLAAVNISLFTPFDKIGDNSGA